MLRSLPFAQGVSVSARASDALLSQLTEPTLLVQGLLSGQPSLKLV